MANELINNFIIMTDSDTAPFEPWKMSDHFDQFTSYWKVIALLRGNPLPGILYTVQCTPIYLIEITSYWFASITTYHHNTCHPTTLKCSVWLKCDTYVQYKHTSVTICIRVARFICKFNQNMYTGVHQSFYLAHR